MIHHSRNLYSSEIRIPPVNLDSWISLYSSRVRLINRSAPGVGEPLGDQFTPQPPDTLRSCYRNNAGYASQMANSLYIRLSNPGITPPTLNAVSCSGYTSPGILEGQVNGLQLPYAADRLVLLSAGGNDLGFSTIARACFTPFFGRCQSKIDDGRATLYGAAFQNNFRDLLRGILNRPGFFCPRETARSCNTAIYQTSCKYSKLLLDHVWSHL